MTKTKKDREREKKVKAVNLEEEKKLQDKLQKKRWIKCLIRINVE